MIIDLQRRIHEVGRIRIGQQVPTSGGKTRPAKLDTFRLTSPDQRCIEQAAHLYGGTPAKWQAPAGMQWEVVTETDTLNVIVPPSDMAFSQHYELWSGGGCQRRCDGVSETLSDGPCLCDPDNRECSIHTRLSVMLADLAGLGVWRIDTQGYYAAVELQGAVGVVQMAAGRGQMLPARLRLEQRMVKRPDTGTRRFAVPVLDVAITPAQLVSGATTFDPLEAGTVAIEPPRNGALTPVPDTVTERPTPTVQEQAATTRQRKPRKNAAQPIPATGLAPRTVDEAKGNIAAAGLTADEPPVEEPPLPLDEPVSPQQLKLLAIRFRDHGIDDRQARIDFCAQIIGRALTSSKELTKAEASDVIDQLDT